jgi:hypothetical protein
MSELELEMITEEVKRLQQTGLIYVSAEDVKKVSLRSNVRRGFQDAAKWEGRYPMSKEQMKSIFDKHISKVSDDIKVRYYDFIRHVGSNEVERRAITDPVLEARNDEIEDQPTQSELKKQGRKNGLDEPYPDASFVKVPKVSIEDDDKLEQAPSVETSKQNDVAAFSAPRFVDAESSGSKKESKSVGKKSEAKLPKKVVPPAPQAVSNHDRVSYVMGTGTHPEIRSIDVASGLLIPVKAVPKTTDLVDPERFIRSSVFQSSEPYRVIDTFETNM